MAPLGQTVEELLGKRSCPRNRRPAFLLCTDRLDLRPPSRFQLPDAAHVATVEAEGLEANGPDAILRGRLRKDQPERSRLEDRGACWPGY